MGSIAIRSGFRIVSLQEGICTEMENLTYCADAILKKVLIDLKILGYHMNIYIIFVKKVTIWKDSFTLSINSFHLAQLLKLNDCNFCDEVAT